MFSGDLFLRILPPIRSSTVLSMGRGFVQCFRADSLCCRKLKRAFFPVVAFPLVFCTGGPSVALAFAAILPASGPVVLARQRVTMI
jgi:hypothetical protein